MFFFYIFLQKLKQNTFKKNKKVFRQAQNSTNAITKEKKEKKNVFFSGFDMFEFALFA